jgi:hypothetical protein
MTNNKQLNTEPKCTCVEHDPYCCQIHGSCPVCVKPEDPKDVVLGNKTSLVAQTLDSKENKQQTALRWFLDKLLKDGYIKRLPVLEFQQAKEMEKEQSIGLIKQTAMFMAASHLDEEISNMSYEDVYKTYYEQTYGGGEQ